MTWDAVPFVRPVVALPSCPELLSLSIRIWLVANYQPPTDRTLAGAVLMVIPWR